MPESTWDVSEPRKLTFTDPVHTVSVRIVSGMVNIVGTDEPPAAGRPAARLEVTEIEGPPLQVSLDNGTLTVTYRGVPWNGFLKWVDPSGWRRRAVVSLAVPATARVQVGVVGASAVVSGIRGATEVSGVSGDTTLVGLSGPVRAETVSGPLEAQAVTGSLRFNSVSGDLTVVEGAGSTVHADSVSGSMVIDLEPAGAKPDIKLNTVSGEVAVRLPGPADTRVSLGTASGSVSSAFEELRVSGQWGAKKITGKLGDGSGSLRATTVSGAIALLRRPPAPEGAAPAQAHGKER